MTKETVVEIIKRELPALLREDLGLRVYLLDLMRQDYADRASTESRFDRVLDELRRDREAQERKWEENNRKWEEQNRKWDEFMRADAARWEESRRKWDEQDRKWDDARREGAAREAAWRQEFDQVHEEIMALSLKIDRSIGALGARWGMRSEKSFRDALAGILDKSFGVSVTNVTEFDETGEVFGRPDQVELDIVIHNGLLLILELKSSIDKAGMYIFERKARFYERRHQRKANRLIVISPMIDPRAVPVAERLGIETYGDSLEVPLD